MDRCENCNRLFAGRLPVGAVVVCFCGRLNTVKTAATAEPPNTHTQERLKICKQCEHRQDNRCGILISRGKPGFLMHHKGLPNPSAKCPDCRWLPTADLAPIPTAEASD